MTQLTKTWLFPFVIGAAIIGGIIAYLGCIFLDAIGVFEATVKTVQDMYKEDAVKEVR